MSHGKLIPTVHLDSVGEEATLELWAPVQHIGENDSSVWELRILVLFTVKGRDSAINLVATGTCP